MPTLRSSQIIPAPRDEVFAFFAEPRNLARITPPALGFELRSSDVRMRAGLDLEYRLRPLLGMPADVALSDRRLRSARLLRGRPGRWPVPTVVA